MTTKTKIALSVPGAEDLKYYFSLWLKQKLENEPSEYPEVSKILAISDIEGNFQAFRKLLVKSGVIDNKYRWIFGDGHLVVLGDCFDRGEEVAECLWLIYALEEKARKQGGYVHFILGNHEIMNLNGDWRYMHPKYAIKSDKSRTPPVAIYQGNSELWNWLQTKNIIEKIGGVLFVHGGIAEELLNCNVSLTDINKIARPYYSRAWGPFPSQVLELLFNAEVSPFWYRGYYDRTATESLVDATLSVYKVQTIITGHTVVPQISTYYNHKVVNINTNHALGNSEALLIRENKYIRINEKNGLNVIK